VSIGFVAPDHSLAKHAVAGVHGRPREPGPHPPRLRAGRPAQEMLASAAGVTVSTDDSQAVGEAVRRSSNGRTLLNTVSPHAGLAW